MTAGFRDRKNWGLQMQRQYADPVYDAYFRSGTVQPIDTESDESDAALAVDKAGTDKIVQTDAGPVQVAQRLRTRTLIDEQRGKVLEPDFSLRESTDGSLGEYRQLISAHRTGGNVPAIYAFGVGRGTDPAMCLERGLRRMVFVQTRDLLQAILDDELEPSAVSDVDETTRARFYRLDQLRRADVVRDEIQFPTIRDAWADDRQIGSDFARYRKPGARSEHATIFDYT